MQTDREKEIESALGSISPNTPTGHGDVDVPLRDAHAFALELQYHLEQGQIEEEFDLDYAHRLAARLRDKLRYIEEELPRVLRMAADGRLDPPEEEAES